MSAGDLFFVDSNLLLCSVDPAAKDKRERALDWLTHLWMDGSGRLSWQVLHEFHWHAVGKMRLKPAKVRAMVEDFAQWQPVENTIGLVREAWGWMDSAQLAYWDALIVAAAERSGARYLLSEDFQTGRQFGEVRVLNPFERRPSDFA